MFQQTSLNKVKKHKIAIKMKFCNKINKEETKKIVLLYKNEKEKLNILCRKFQRQIKKKVIGQDFENKKFG